MLNYHSLSAIQQDLYAGRLECVELVEHYLSRIQSHTHLHVFTEVFEEEALARARQLDKQIKEGKAGKMAGLVLGLKDVLCYKGHHLSASSQILKNFKSLFTATAVQRLLDEGAIIIGRQNCDEFAMGSSTENSSLGPTLNPVDTEHVPGGSSGGSAAAVSAGLCHASLGSDTGGSVRQPAAFCGVVGLKPTYGRISRWGLIAYASSFDQIGPITHSVEDAARLLQVMAGPDGRDNTASTHPLDDYAAAVQAQQGPYTIGYIKETIENEGLDPEIRDRIKGLIRQLKSEGHTLIELEFPILEYVVPCYYILTTAEASSNLSRYDGVRYGYRSEEAASLDELYRLSRSEGFGEEVKRRIMLGTFVLSAGYYDAYYTHAMKVRRMIRDATVEMFKSCDVILTPTAPSPAFRIGEKSDDPVAMYLSDIYTVHANLAGIPAISLPLYTHSNGLPIGIQLMANYFQESTLLSLSQQLMK